MTIPIRNGKMRVGQHRLFWRETGSGPTLVLLHGNWQDSEQWLPVLESLGRHFHCVAPDLLGYGESSHLAAQAYSIQAECECLQDFLAQLRIRPQVLVAQEIGAWVAVRYALLYPEQVKGLVLLAPEGIDHAHLERRWQDARWLSDRWALRFWLLRALRPFIKALRGDRWWRSVQQQRRVFRRYAATCRLLFQRKPSDRQMEVLNEALAQLKCPVLLLHPAAATATVQLSHQLFQQWAPHTETVEIPGDGQVWPVEVQKLVYQFANEVSRDRLRQL